MTALRYGVHNVTLKDRPEPSALLLSLGFVVVLFAQRRQTVAAWAAVQRRRTRPGRGRVYPRDVDEWSTMARWYRLGIAIGVTALVGCGAPTPDGPVSSPSTGSADAVVSPPTGDAPRAGLAAPQAPTPETRSTDSSQTTSPAPDARAKTAASPADPLPSDARAVGQVQRKVQELWYAEVREHPDATVRLQALELWAQKPGVAIDPVIDALIRLDEQAQARAEALWEQALAQEEAAPQPEEEADSVGPTTL